MKVKKIKIKIRSSKVNEKLTICIFKDDSCALDFPSKSFIIFFQILHFLLGNYITVMNANNEHGTVASFSRLLPESHTPLDSRDGHVSLEDEQTIFRQMHMGKQATSPPKQEEI